MHPLLVLAIALSGVYVAALVAIVCIGWGHRDPSPWYVQLGAWLERRGRLRVIYDRDGKSPYLYRYYLIGNAESRWFAVVLHNFARGDNDPHRHNHPWWWWISLVIAGGYWEDTEDGYRFRRPGDVAICRGGRLHRIELDPRRAGEVWTLFIMGPRRSTWGFATPEGIIPWAEYKKDSERRARLRAESERIARESSACSHASHSPGWSRPQLQEAVSHGD